MLHDCHFRNRKFDRVPKGFRSRFRVGPGARDVFRVKGLVFGASIGAPALLVPIPT